MNAPPPSHRSPPLILGIAGGSGSGKSTIARAILEALPEGRGVLLQQDHYYRSQTHLPESERANVNYDHPDALELDLLTGHDRSKEGLRIEPAPVIVAEGILVLADERLRSRFEVKLFVDTDPDIRL